MTVREKASADPLAGVDWGSVFVQAVAIARACTPERDVEDVAQEGLRMVVEGDAPWNPAGGKSLPQHVADVGVKARSHRRRTERRRKNPKMIGKLVEAFDVPPATPEIRY